MGIFDNWFGKNKSDNSIDIEPPKHSKGNVTVEKTDVTCFVSDELQKRFIAFDVETTGLSSCSDRIVELGAVVFENGQITSQYSTLVNPGCQIPLAATKVNHITNDMLTSAPSELQVYPTFVNYLGDALQGKTIICAHNATFDMGFLSETLERLGYNGNIRYVDTLSLSRRRLTLENYKQNTIADHYGFTNINSHRAGYDAEICGKILWELLKEQDKEQEVVSKSHETPIEIQNLTDEELEICAVIQNAILNRGGNSRWMGFHKNSSGYVVAHNLYPFAKFKIVSKGQYIIIPASIKTPAALPVEKCSVSEGGTNFVRLYFSTPFNIEFLGDYFFSEYTEMDNSRRYYFSNVKRAQKEAENSLAYLIRINDADIQQILERAKARKYDAVPIGITTKRIIKREDVIVNAVHNRCPLSQIANTGNPDYGFTSGFPLYLAGEDARKNGDYLSAIDLYDKARAAGYDAPALYEAYTKAFRKMKDYANEILIVEEFMERYPTAQFGELEARRNKAIELLYDLQQAEKIKDEKALARAQKQRERAEAKVQKQKEKEEAKANMEPSSTNKRAIMQMDDNGNVIKTYESVTMASNEIGVSTKSIRDAAKGVQKHAGGFVWKYKDEYDVETVISTSDL